MVARLLALRGGAAGYSGKHIEACLFDFDGTLAQSEDTHRRTFSEILGFELTEEYWNTHCVGHSPRKLLETNMPSGRLDELGETFDALLVKRSALFEQHIERGLLEATSGAQELLAELRRRGVRCAVVSSGSRSYIEKALHALGVATCFEFIIAGDDEEVLDHKPHPLPYLLAARRMDLSPEVCLAFEDTITGIRSAQAAGMRVVAMRTAGTAHLAVLEAGSGSHRSAPSSDQIVHHEGVHPVAALVHDFTEVPRSLLDA